MMPSPNIDKKYYEILWANSAVLEDEHEVWKGFHSTNRIYLRDYKKLVLWRCQDQKPSIIDTMEITDIHASFREGFSVTLNSALHPDSLSALKVTHTPKLLPFARVFIWIPYFFDLRFAPRVFDASQERKSLTFPLCIKTFSNPKIQLSEGCDYATEANSFAHDWPTFKLL